jgi:metal-responsive CopG/Arc/MetJ family transcriptional regulator
METVQIVLEKKLLHATDQAARRMKQNRSAFVREALHEYLRRLNLNAKEEKDRVGYSKEPAGRGEARIWEAEAVWPPE